MVARERLGGGTTGATKDRSHAAVLSEGPHRIMSRLTLLPLQARAPHEQLSRHQARPDRQSPKLVQLSKRGGKFMLATERSVARIERDFQKMLGAAVIQTEARAVLRVLCKINGTATA
jgi:hypothetical protein